MAKMHPDVNETRVIFASRAEQVVYNICRDELPDSWHVYSSCTVSTLENEAGMRDNEIDFLFYHPDYGVIAVEVKGGRIRYDREKACFYSVNRHDDSFKIKNPFKQVLIWKGRFLRYLRHHGIKVPVSHAVCFPSVLESDVPESAEIEPRLIIGINRLKELEKSLVEIVTRSQPARYLDFQDVHQRLSEIIEGASFTTRLRLRDYLDNHELRLKDIEAITETLVGPIASQAQMAIEGEAGTGKTMIAIMLARHFRDEGKNVLLLSGNPLMNSVLKREVGASVEVSTFIECGLKHRVNLLRKPVDFEGTNEDWTQFDGPEALLRAVEESAERYDVLICDEGQDVQPFWWEAFEGLLRSREESHFYIFFDRSQGVFGSGTSSRGFDPEETIPISPPYFPLINNYRTTREIAGFSRQFRTGKAILKSHCGRFGYKPRLILYKDEGDFKSKLRALFKTLFEQEGLKTDEVTLLSARSPFTKGSVLQTNGPISRYPLYDLTRSNRRKTMPSQREIGGRIKTSTVASFKGLETPIGVIVNLSEYNLPIDNPIMSSLIYVASTRAKHMLYILMRQDDEKHKVIQKALSQVEDRGAMVLEGSSADYEFTGKVTHYNPDRVGWLRVDDPAFQKKNVMFFPSDVAKAGISDIRLGARIRFRPKLEGQVVIASELKLGKGVGSAKRTQGNGG